MGLSKTYGKSGKGAQVLTGKAKALPANSMRVLAQVDGKTNAKAIMTALDSFTEQEFAQILAQLLEGGYIRIVADDAMKDFFPDSGVAGTIDVVEISVEEFHKTEAAAHAIDSDTKIRQQKEAEARAKAHGEEQLKLEAIARAQKESERKLLEAADLLAKSGDKINTEGLAAEEAKRQARLREEALAKAGVEARTKHEAEARRAVEHKTREEAVAKAKAFAEAREKAERKARHEAEAHAKRVAEEKAKHEAEEKARRAAEQKTREEAIAREIEWRKARQEAEARAKREAEGKAKREAEQKMREEAALKAETEAREKAKRKAREEAEAHAKQEASESARIATEEKEREETERIARKQAETEEKAEAKLTAKREADERAATRAETKVRKRGGQEPIDINKWSRTAFKIIRKLLISLSFTFLALLLLLQLVNLSMLVSPLVEPIEKIVSQNINEPVTINKVYASLWPKPHLVLSGIAIGGLADIKIETIRVLPVLSTVFDDVKTLRYIELSGLTIGQDNILRPLQWMSASNKQGKLKFNQIFLEKTSVSLHGLELPPFDGDIKLTPEGKFQSATLNTANQNAVIKITPKNEGYVIDMVADDWPSPIGVPAIFSELHATGVIDHNQLNLTEIKGRLYGGNIKAAMVVDWANQWSASGTFKLSEVELEELMPNFTTEASLKGPLTTNAAFKLKADEFAAMFNTPEIIASFSVDDGTINGIDLARAINASSKNSAVGGSTRFNKFSGKLLLKDRYYQYSQLTLKAGRLGAFGAANILANQNISGEININLTMQSRQLQSHLGLSGKLGSLVLK